MTASSSGRRIGTVYGVLLNDRPTVTHLAAAFRKPPYGAAPIAPVLFVKPRNTIADADAAVAVPSDPGRVRAGGTIGAVFGRDATRVNAEDALAHVAGYAIVADYALDRGDDASFFRPAVRERCRDGFCPVGPVVAAEEFDPSRVTVVTRVNGVERERFATSGLVRSLPHLIADVTAFMTLAAGDVLLVGYPARAPVARIGESVAIEVAGLGTLANAIVAEERLAA